MKANSGFYPAAPVRDPVPKTPMLGDPKNKMNSAGFAAMQQALAGAKRNKPMKKPKMNVKMKPDFVKKAM